MKEKELVPKRRFKEFQNTDAWEQRKLGELCDKFQSGKNIKSEDILDKGRYPVFGGNGFRGYTNTYNHNGLYALIGRQGALCGNMNISDGKAYFTEHAVSVKGNKNNETRFLFYLLGKMNLGQYSGQSAQPGLAVNKLIELTAVIPTFAEQAQISVLLKKLDNTIALHQRKLEKTKALKSAYLAEMFPAEGERVPKRRFAGFKEEWEVRKLGDIVTDISDGDWIQKEHVFNEGKFRIIQTGNLEIGRYLDKAKSAKYFHQKDFMQLNANEIFPGDILISRLAEPAGRTIVLPNTGFRMVTSVDIAIVRPDNTFDKMFFMTLMNSEKVLNIINKEVTGTTHKRISRKNLERIQLIIPTVTEQNKIGEFFKRFDDTITNHQLKLDKLKATKQAYLQEMFV